MRRAGAQGLFRVASHPERLNLLLAKLIEEATELQRAPGIGELADVTEVVGAIRHELALSARQVEAERLRKKKERGGFNRGFVLKLDGPL